MLKFKTQLLWVEIEFMLSRCIPWCSPYTFTHLLITLVWTLELKLNSAEKLWRKIYEDGKSVDLNFNFQRNNCHILTVSDSTSSVNLKKMFFHSSTCKPLQRLNYLNGKSFLKNKFPFSQLSCTLHMWVGIYYWKISQAYSRYKLNVSAVSSERGEMQCCNIRYIVHLSSHFKVEKRPLVFENSEYTHTQLLQRLMAHRGGRTASTVSSELPSEAEQ